MKLIKGTDPLNTIQLIRLQNGGQSTWHKYRVISITDAKATGPTVDGPTVYFELAEKSQGWLQTYIAIPLVAFENRVVSATKADVFWEQTKTHADN